MRSKEIQVPIYFASLTIVQGNSIRKISKRFNLKLDRYYNFKRFSALTIRIERNGSPKYYLVFGKTANYREIAHECCHLVNYIFKDIGVEIDMDNDEPQCYLLGYLVGECIKMLKGVKKPN